MRKSLTAAALAAALALPAIANAAPADTQKSYSFSFSGTCSLNGTSTVVVPGVAGTITGAEVAFFEPPSNVAFDTTVMQLGSSPAINLVLMGAGEVKGSASFGGAGFLEPTVAVPWYASIGPQILSTTPVSIVKWCSGGNYAGNATIWYQ